MFQPDRYAPPSGHRPPALPSPRLVVPKPRSRRGAAIAVAIHAALILAIFWKGAELMAGAGEGPGPRGGGGGGGRQAMHLFLLAGAGTPQAVPIPPVPQMTVKVPLPDPVELNLPKVQPPAPVVTQVATAPGTGNGTTGGPGEGPGSGGGKGAGTGTGVGNDSGPGSGGNGLSSSLPFVLTWPIPPACLPRGRYTIHFWVTEAGSISKAVIEPRIKNADCQRDFERRAYDYKFLPAKTRSGIPVASTYDATVIQQ